MTNSSTLACFGARRILFGSYSNVFPAGWRADRAAEHRAALQAAGVDAAAPIGASLSSRRRQRERENTFAAPRAVPAISGGAPL